MFLLETRYDIHDKINALNGSQVEAVDMMDYVSWGIIGILILLAAYVVSRGLFRVASAGQVDDRRGLLKRRLTTDEDKDGLLAIGKVLKADHVSGRNAGEDSVLLLKEVAAGTRVALYWNAGELRCGCRGVVGQPEGEHLLVRFDSDSAPKKGQALLVCPETEGHASFYEVNMVDSPDAKTRVLGSATIRSASRMNRRYRAHVALPAAVIQEGEDENENQDPMLVRVHDMAFEGLGVLGEGPLAEDENVVLRLQLPGYLDPLTLVARVAWSERDLAGLYRAGLRLDCDSLDVRLTLADYMFGRIKAESSDIILEQRREQNSPVKPQYSPVDDSRA